MSATCEQATGLSDGEYWRSLTEKINAHRIPFSGSLALTHRCNLRCLHCYARDGAAGNSLQDELNADQWRRIIGEIQQAGCLYLLLTGGEPLLRQDFPEIYAFARKSGFLVTVFTNGSLIDDRIMSVFSEMPPSQVEISLYGADAGTHDRVTGFPGSFRLARLAVEKLLGAGMAVALKSVLMSVNAGEISEIEKIAEEYHVRFRLDPAVFPALSGDRAPLDLRVPPEQAVACEFAHPARAREWEKFHEHHGKNLDGRQLYICGAGRRTFHVDSHGFLYPCLMVRSTRVSLQEASFAEAWRGKIACLLDEEIAPDSPCDGCDKKDVCGYCPGFFEMENGSSRLPSQYLCDLGRYRQRAISRQTIGG